MEVLYFPFLSGQDGTDWLSLTKHDHSRAATHVRDYRHGGTFRIEMTGLALAATAALSCPTDAKRGWWPCERTQGLSPRPPKKTHKQGRTAIPSGAAGSVRSPDTRTAGASPPRTQWHSWE
jgi:hypothetical protein